MAARAAPWPEAVSVPTDTEVADVQERSLAEGKLDGEVVTCPWHASRFRFEDGRVVEGPATFDQPAYLVREEGDKVQVRLPAPLH